MKPGAPAAEIAVEAEIRAAGSGRRERRKAETRRRLLRAARELFVARGYDATRPQDIARAADVAAGTFYVHFADKREVFRAFTAQASHELMERVRRHVRGADGFEKRLLASLEALCAYSDESPGVLRAAFADEAVAAAGPRGGESLRERLAASVAGELRRGMAAGELRRDYDAAMIATGMVGLIEQALSHGAQSGLERRALLEQITRFCVRALVGTPDASHPEAEK